MSVAHGNAPEVYGRHSLEAWGYRLKCFKGDFGKHEGSWEEYTPEMLDYCIQDTLVTQRLYELHETTNGDLLASTTPKKGDPLTHEEVAEAADIFSSI